MSDEATPIMVRARLTPDEWADIRKRAIDANMSTSDYVALLLREGIRAVDGFSRAVK
jgi:mobilization protein NikA